jgi:hypothetical protein
MHMIAVILFLANAAYLSAPGKKIDFSSLAPEHFEHAHTFASNQEQKFGSAVPGAPNGSQKFLSPIEEIYPCIDELKKATRRPVITIYEEFHGEPSAERTRRRLTVEANSGKSLLAVEGEIYGNAEGAKLFSQKYNKTNPSKTGINGLEDADISALSNLRVIYEVSAEKLESKQKGAITQIELNGILGMIADLAKHNPTLKTLVEKVSTKKEAQSPRQTINALKAEISQIAYSYAKEVKSSDKYSQNKLFDPEDFNFSKIENLKGIPSITDNWKIEILARNAAFARNAGKVYCKALKAGKDLNIVVGAYHTYSLLEFLEYAGHLDPKDPCYRNEHLGRSKGCSPYLIEPGKAPESAIKVDTKNSFVDNYKPPKAFDFDPALLNKIHVVPSKSTK